MQYMQGMEDIQHKRTRQASAYQFALDAACIITTTDSRGVIVSVNDNFQRTSKYSSAEVVGRTLQSLVSTYHSKQFLSNMWATISSGNIWKGEIKFRARNGSGYWLESTIIPLLDDTGKPYQFLSIGNDITRRKTAEEEIVSLNHLVDARVTERAGQIMQARNELEKLFTNISEVFFSIDLIEGKLLQMSASCLKVFGYSSVEFTNNIGLMREIIHPADADLVADNHDKLKSGIEAFLRYRIIHKNDSIRWIEARIIPTIDNRERLIRIDGVCSDITEREKDRKEIERTNAALKFSKSRFKNMFDHSLEGLLLGKPDGSLIEMNDAFCKLVGYTRDELVKMNRTDITVPGDQIMINALKTRHEKGSFNGRVKMVRKGGEVIDVEISSSIFADHNDEIFTYLSARNITEQVKAEKELRDSENRFRALIENGKDIITLMKADGSIIYRSPTFEHVLGFTREELDAQPSFENVHPDDRAELAMLLKQVLVNPGVTVQSTWRQKHKNGSWRWMQGTAVNCINYPPVNAVINNFRDVTEQKEAEKKLADANRELNQLFNSIDEVLYSAGRHPYRLIQMSASCEKVYGYAVNEFFENPYLWRSLIHPADRYVVDDLEQKLERGEMVSVQYRIVHKTGAIKWLEARLTPTLDSTGRLIRVDGVNRDITEKKAADEQISLSQQRFQALIEKSSDVIMLADKHGKFIYVSPSVKTVLGYEADELIGRAADTVTHPDDKLRNYELVSSLENRPGDYVSTQTRVLHKDGSWRWIEASVTNQLSEPAVRATVTNFRDITERKAAEKEIADLNHSLEEKIADRTARLRDANKTLEAFSYSAAHDLQAPLRIISSYIQVAHEDLAHKLDKNEMALLSTIQTNANKMSQLIGDLLKFSRFTRTAVTPVKVNMDEVVADVLLVARELKPDLKTDFDVQHLGHTWCDANLIRQVWMNLISNAIKYSGKSPSPKVTIGAFEKDGSTVYFIKDNGVGFDMRNVGHLFEVFHRLHKVEEFEGSGIGLALVSNIITRHGGKIWAEAEVNNGATFYFTVA